MADPCYNYLTIKTTSEESKEQLKLFKNKLVFDNESFSLQTFHPTPKSLNITPSTQMKYGLAILLFREGYSFMLNKYLNLKWVKNKDIKTCQELEMYLLTHNMADLVLGKLAKKNLVTHIAITWYDWRIYNWGTKGDASDIEIVERNDELFIVRFTTPWSPPLKWIIKVSMDYPELLFVNEYYVNSDRSTDGILISVNGEGVYEYIDNHSRNTEITNDKIKSYRDGAILIPKDDKNQPLPYKLYVKKSSYLIATYSIVFKQSKADHQIDQLEAIIDELRGKYKNILKYNINSKKNSLEVNLMRRINCKTITEAIQSSNSLIEDIRRLFDLRIGSSK